MLKSIYEAIVITNKNIVIATPLILFSLISVIYLGISANSGNRLILLFSIFLSLLMISAFIAGWFKMVKLATLYPDGDSAGSLLKSFPEGVGEYFLSTLLTLINITVIVFIGFLIAGVIGHKFIGVPEISVPALTGALESPETLKMFLSTLSDEQLAKIGLWNILFLAVPAVSYFLMIFYIPALFFKTKNAFKSLWLGLVDLFSKKFFEAFIIYLIIFGLYFIISIVSAFVMKNIVLNFLMTLLGFYFKSVIAVWVFHYYYHNFVESQIGRNIDMRV